MTRYAIPAPVLRAELHGEEVLLNPETGIYHLVNATGHEVVSAVVAGSNLDDVVERIADETGESPARVSADVDAFVRALIDRGLLLEVSMDRGSGS